MNKREITVTIDKVKSLALKLALPILIIYLIPYGLLWDWDFFKGLTISKSALLLLLILPGIVVHELLHGLFFAIFAPSGYRAIRFGFKWEALAPYCHCNEPVRILHYIICALAPLILLGIIPAIYGIAKANIFVLWYGIYFTWAAAGDIYSVWLLYKYPWQYYIKDHPEEIGFILVDEIL